MKCHLKEILASRGIKSNWLADKVGVHTTSISRISTGVSIPTLETAIKISKVLNVDITDIWETEE